MAIPISSIDHILSFQWTQTQLKQMTWQTSKTKNSAYKISSFNSIMKIRNFKTFAIKKQYN